MIDRDPILVEREKAHGDFFSNAQVWMDLNRIVNKNKKETFKDPRMNLALCMMLLKLSRLIQNHEVKDHWLDIAGYAKLGAEACE